MEIAFAAILGAIIGSFLNVVIWRLRRVESLATPRFNTQLRSVLGALGLVLAVVGIYGVIG